MKCENDLCGLRIDDGFCVFSRTRKDGCPQREKAKGRAALMEWGEKTAKELMASYKITALHWLEEYDRSIRLRLHCYHKNHEWNKFVESMAEYANLEFMLERAKGQ